jgi:hypothetical protein
MKTAEQLQVELTHEMHDHEQLKGRMRRLLAEHAELLDVAARAIRKGKTDVAAERVDYVADALRAELARLAA